MSEINLANIQDLRSLKDKGKKQEEQKNVDNSDNSVNSEQNDNSVDNSSVHNINNTTIPKEEKTDDGDSPLNKTAKDILSEVQSINQKISKFGEMLKEKLQQPTSEQPEPEVENNSVPEAEPSNKEQTEEKDDNKTYKKKKDSNTDSLLKSLIMQTPLGKMIPTMNGGFGGLMKVGNKIASTLFTMSISAALETAKMAAMILALIVGFDLIKIYLKYFIDWIGKKWDELTASWEGYFKDFGKFGTILDQICTGIGQVVNAFKTGDFPAIVTAIVKATANLYNKLGETIRFALTKGLAAVVRALGFKDTADDMDKWNEQKYADETNGNLTTKEEKDVAHRQSEAIKKGEDYSNRGYTSFMPLSWRNKLNIVDDDHYNVAQAEQKATPALQKMDDSTREDALVKINQVKKMAFDYKDHSEAANVGSSADMKRLDNEYNDIQARLSDKVFDQVPQIREAIRTELFQSKQAVDIRTPKSEQPSASEDVKTAQQIQKNQDADIAGIVTNPGSSTANVANTQINNSRNIQVQAPVTGSRAPGVFNSGGVN